MTDVAVVIVSHNSRSDLESSLPLVGADPRHVIVVDNASTDGTRAFVRRLGNVDLIELPKNVGYGAACNAGIARASASLVLLLNPDAWPVGNGIEQLAACAERQPTLGAVGPVLHGPDGTRQRSLVGFPTAWWLGRPPLTSTHSRTPILTLPRLRDTRKFIVGAALLVRREAFEQVGGFDPSFFMFYEEVDLCWRLHEAGWGVAVCPKANFVHIGGTATRRNWTVMYREQLRGHLRFLAKHHGARRAERARKVLIAAMWVRGLACMIARRPERRRLAQDAAAWLRLGTARSLLETTRSGETPRSRTP